MAAVDSAAAVAPLRFRMPAALRRLTLHRRPQTHLPPDAAVAGDAAAVAAEVDVAAVECNRVSTPCG